MFIFSRCTIILLGLVASAGIVGATDSALLVPDSGDPALARARAGLQHLNQTVQTLGNHTIEEIVPTAKAGKGPLSVPRWGLSESINQPSPVEAILSRSPERFAGKFQWPKCAAKAARVDHTTNDAGTWYSDTYDYGCIQIGITGNRAYAPGLVPPNDAGSDDCSAEARQARPLAANAEGDSNGRFELNLSLNGLPYSIEGSCSKDALGFCKSRAAQCGIVDRLILLGDQPL
jgi:hypothetical protein